MEDLQKEFVPYGLALRMKQLGFDEPCFSYYMNGILQPSLNVKDYSYFKEMIEINSNIKNFENVLAPLYQQAFRWFREKYDWTIKINKILKHTWSFTLENFTLERELFGGRFETYEESESACLKKLIEIVENKKHL
jgi:hypothetical protein